ncbi:MAG: 2-isopropylmalate synthase [Pseudomonadota bacterium]
MNEQTPIAADEQADPQDRVKIFDTTMRDGEQSPGASMTLAEKLQIGQLLDEMGVDIIEAGFPIASEGDFEAVTEVSKVVENATVCGLSRSPLGDIDRAFNALKHAKKPRIHTFIATSDLHMEFKLQMTRDQVLNEIQNSVSHAKSLGVEVQWSPEDATRTDRDFLCTAVQTAIENGATTINIPDTVGYTAPGESAEIIRMLKERVPGIDDVTISTHCHNDLGMATANSMAAVLAGARQIECTVNGLGERAGNTAMEEVVMAMKVRNDIMPFATRIDTTRIMQASRLISSVTGFPVQYNKAVVGKNAFAHEAGIHQDGMLKHAGTYEIMTPESVGLTESTLAMGKHSGRHALKSKLSDLGIDVGDNQLKELFVRFKALADRKKEVFDDDILALVEQQTADAGAEHVKLKFLRVICGTEAPQSADIILEIDGREQSVTAQGDGPVDAAFNAVMALVPHNATLELYQVHAVTQGTDAQATVSVRLREGGHIASAQSSDTDTVVASCRAYVHAINKLMVRREKSAPTAIAG